MADDKNPVDPIEAMLADLHDAECAGVFRDTAIEPAELLAKNTNTAPVVSRPWWLRAAPVAAAILLTVTVWSVMFAVQLREVRHTSANRWVDSRDAVSTRLVSMKTFAECRNGPADTPLSPACVRFDYDADGDVDQRDFSSFQVAMASDVPTPSDRG